jgi:serine/threonine protein kinase
MDNECTKNRQQNDNKKHSYEIVRRLGKGAFGVTYLVKKGDEMYVLKAIRLTPKNIGEVYTEIDVLKKIAKYGCRKDILCYHDQFVNCDDQTLNIVTYAFKDAITLTDYIRSYQRIKAFIPRKDLLTVMYNISNALYYLSKIGVAHGDIKPDNILINEKTLDIQIIDFGLSCSKNCRPSGTIMFASPEILKSIGPSAHDISLGTLQSADVFSLGVVFYLLANLKLPYSTTKGHQYDVSESDYRLEDLPYDEQESVAQQIIREQNIKFTQPIDISNELAAIVQLYRYYKNTILFSMYNNNETETDKQINELIESMLKLDTKTERGRPSMRTVLAKLKKISGGDIITPVTATPI